jgi:site-specific recombinase XerD
MSNSNEQSRQNSSLNVFSGLFVRPGEEVLFQNFLQSHDLAATTQQALMIDLRKFVQWFTTANHEPFEVKRVTVRDIADFRDYMHRDKGQAVATINRNLSCIRKYFKWLHQQGHILNNPSAVVKELRRQPLAPQGMERSEIRRLMREVELRQDVRANAIFSLILYTGARLSDVCSLELSDLIISERSGQVNFRFGKGSKQRSCPLPLQGRKALQDYLAVRPPVASSKVFLGERGPLNKRGIQVIFEKYKVLTGIEKLHPHLLRHVYAKQFLAQGGNLVQLAQILGHESLQSTSVYTRSSMDDLSSAAENISY